MARATVIFVFPADRGHFQPSIPLAQGLAARGHVAVEYITHVEALEWVPEHERITAHGTLGSFPRAFTSSYVELSANGNSIKEGRASVSAHMSSVLADRGIETVEFSDVTGSVVLSADVAAVVRDRVSERDVVGVVAEGTWCGFMREVVIEKPLMVLNPSVWGQLCLKEDLPADVADACMNPTIDDLAALAKEHGCELSPHLTQPTTYILAEPLRSGIVQLIPSVSRYVGPILPIALLDDGSNANGNDDALLEFMRAPNATTQGGEGKDASFARDVVYCSLGSHMMARVLNDNHLNGLVEGILGAEFTDGGETFKARCVLVVNERVRGRIHEKHVLSGRLLLVPWVRDPCSLLRSDRLRLFLSHCGANSVHEAMACGTRIVACPMFDDQYPNAMAVERCGAGVRLQSKELTASEVRDAVTLVGNNATMQQRVEEISEQILASAANPTLQREIEQWATGET